jgi:hypothetical protein
VVQRPAAPRPKNEPTDRPESEAARPTDERAELPLSDLPAPRPYSERPAVYLPPIGRPTIALRAHLAALRLRDKLIAAWSWLRAWVRGHAWPWLLARGRDKSRKGRIVLIASLVAVCALLALGISVCVGGSNPAKLSEPPATSSGLP